MKYVILAGGSGTRLWPLSRKNYAKQFLTLNGRYSMLQNTALRVSKQNGKDIFVISDAGSSGMIFDQINAVLKDFTSDNIISEPEGRNTAPAIAYGSIFFDETDNIAILSSDHYIKDQSKFNAILDQADLIADKGYIVTLGIVPDSPKTGYGYIKKSDKKTDGAFFAEKFVEKPDLKTAVEYMKSGVYYWNAGIFIFKIKTFTDEIKIHSPGIYETLQSIKKIKAHGGNATINDYRKFDSISIDYALMEKTKNMIIIPSDIGWNDIGSFRSLYEVLDRDADGNAVCMPEDKFINIDSKNVLVMGNKRIISAVNIKDLAVIDTDDALLISDIGSTEKVKDVYNRLKEIKSVSCIEHKVMQTQYGITASIDDNMQKITVNQGKSFIIDNKDYSKISIIILNGAADISSGDKKSTAKKTDNFFIDKGDAVRIANNSYFDNLELLVIKF